MILYSMTATFGKLEHQTLTLEPGLNVIQAPNEWGKSTWCAFLLAMLYGLDTRAKATRTSLPEKERYAPWSGSPMSGRMELNWQGRDITIERTTRGRVPLGEFRAYETESGLPVMELNAGNCGQLLLGVERSVFQRAGFIRQADLPVTQDDDLRRRLNALVTTGDESGDAARLEKGLRELKNRCRYNRTGLLPQAMQQREQLEQTLAELSDLQTRLEQTEKELKENDALQASLSNHLDALAYGQAQADAQKVALAQSNCRRAEERLAQLEESCAHLPDGEEIEAQLSRLSAHRQRLEDVQQHQQSLPLPPERPLTPTCFLGLTPEQAIEQAEADSRTAQRLSGLGWALLLTLGMLFFAAAGVLLWLGWTLPGALCAFAGFLLAALSIFTKARNRRRQRELYDRYGSHSPAVWQRFADDYALAWEEYHRQQEAYSESREALTDLHRELRQQHQSLCGQKSVEQCTQEWEACRRSRRELEDARLEAKRCRREYENLKAMARTTHPPAREDQRRETADEADALLRGLEQQEGLLRGKLGQYRGRMEALGSMEALQTQLEQVEGRIRDLERYEAALTLAQQTAAQASEELQRRFSPRISKGAQTLLSRLTLGKYNRLTLAADFSLQAGAQQENTLRSALWRSDGTMDQLYLALRLSVARELTPEAPLILDDALVRFDEQRLEAAMELLQEYAQTHQVILFTCQKRETALLK